MSFTNTHFFHRLIRRYSIALASVFTDIYVQRTDPYDDSVEDSFKVPLTQASKQKFYHQLIQYPNIHNQPFSVLLPRISFILTSVARDSERMRNPVNSYRKAIADDPSNCIKFFQPIPYDFHYSMAVWSVNEDDAHQIIEQILAYFTPHLSITVNEMPTLGIKRSVPIEMTSCSYSPDYESGEDFKTRLITWTLNFTLKGYMYKQNVDSAIIKRTIVKVRDLDDIDSEDPYTYWEQEYEVVPWESLEDDPWELQKTTIQDGITKITMEDKPE